MKLRSLIFVLLTLACSARGVPPRDVDRPGIVFPHRIGEGSGDLVDPDGVSPAPPRASSAPAEPPPNDALPDPEPLRIAEQWEYELAWNAGAMSVSRVTPRVFPNPVVTARRMGRFAIELWIGKELVERVRFDFPMLALDDAANEGRPSAAAPSLGAGAHVKTRVLVPAAPRARSAVLVDRANNTRTQLAWPPSSGAAK